MNVKISEPQTVTPCFNIIMFVGNVEVEAEKRNNPEKVLLWLNCAKEIEI